MTLEVQNYLMSHSLSQLRTEHGVKTSAKAGDYFFSVNYDQIESTPGPLVNQCRGLILASVGKLTEDQISSTRPVGRTSVFARPFDRFFNLGDSNASPIDLDDPSTVFFEKLDGTCCIVWYNPISCTWEVGTRSVPLADRPMTGWEDLTFRNLFERALDATLERFKTVSGWSDSWFENWSNGLDKSNTYVFELTTPLNRIVVDYQEYAVTLLGIRNTQTGEEFAVETLGKVFHGVPVCLSHSLNNEKELLEFVGSKPPFEQEGIVVRDKNFNRVKVKSLAYMAYNRLRDSTANSPRAIMELVLTEKLDDVMPVLEPFMKEKAVQIQDGTRKFFRDYEELYREIHSETVGSDNPRKTFALAVQERKAWMPPLMDRFLGRCSSMQEYIQNRQNKDGTYPDGLLDSLLNMI